MLTFVTADWIIILKKQKQILKKKAQNALPLHFALKPNQIVLNHKFGL